MLELDQECNSKQSSPPSLRQSRRRLQRAPDSSLISKGFISDFLDSNSPEITRSTHREPPIINTPPLHTDAVTSKRKKKASPFTELAPLPQSTSTVVFLNTSRAPQEDEHSFENFSSFHCEQPKAVTVEVKRNNYVSGEGNVIVFHEEEEEHKSRDSTFGKLVSKKRPKKLIYFEAEEEQHNTSKSNSEEVIALPDNRMTALINFNSDSEEEKKPEEEKEEGLAGNVPAQAKVVYRSDQLSIAKPSEAELKHLMVENISANTTLEMALIRNTSGFNSFWPEFYLRFPSEKASLLAAKKVSSKPISTYIISSSPRNFEENSHSYLGKLKSNLFGDVLNLFGPGLNPSNAQEQDSIPRELLATIVFTKTQLDRPREFEVFVKKPEYRYYLNFHQVTMYQDEMPLSELYRYHENRHKIEKYSNRKPVLNTEDGSYRLDFGGKAECKSVKNFILEEQEGREIILFGKANAQQFNISISWPLSALVGFAVALTSFETRLFFNE